MSAFNKNLNKKTVTIYNDDNRKEIYKITLKYNIY